MSIIKRTKDGYIMKVYAEQKADTIFIGVEVTRKLVDDDFTYLAEVSDYEIEMRTDLFTEHNPEFYADYIERWFEADADCRMDEPDDDWDIQEFLEVVRNHVFFEGNAQEIELKIDVELTD